MTKNLTIYGSDGWFENQVSIDITKLKNDTILIVDYPKKLEDVQNTDRDIIYIQVEPEHVLRVADFLIDNQNLYKYIFTYNQKILNAVAHSIIYYYGTTWIKEIYYKNINIEKKHKKISSIAGSKNTGLAGHIFRNQIYYDKDILKKSKIDIIVYVSTRQVPTFPIYDNMEYLSPDVEYKYELFDNFQYSIIIENGKLINYFTEKIIDCLITKTIPIYSGCENISKFFDTSYWIMLDDYSIDNMIEKINKIPENHYFINIDKIEKNYNESKKYIDLGKNMNIRTIF